MSAAPSPSATVVPTTPPNEDEIVIGVSFNRVGPPLFNAWQAYMLSYSEEISARESTGVRLVFSNAEGSAVQQTRDIQRLIQSQVDVIIARPEDTTAITESIQMAQQAGIPFVIFDRPADDPQQAFYVGLDHHALARNTAQKFAEVIRQNTASRLRCIEVLGDSKDAIAVERSTGWQEIEKEIGAWTTVIQARTNWDPDRFYTSIRDAQYWQPDVNCMFLVSDQEFEYAAQALREYNNLAPMSNIHHVWIASIDLTPAGLSAMQQGYIDVAGVYDAYQQATTAIDIAIQLAKGRPPSTKQIFVQGRIVTPEMLQQTPYLWARDFP